MYVFNSLTKEKKKEEEATLTSFASTKPLVLVPDEVEDVDDCIAGYRDAVIHQLDGGTGAQGDGAAIYTGRKDVYLRHKKQY